jgi:predicted nuclease with RNAse H fold
MNILGIDLAGKPKNPTGLCILKENEILFRTVHEDTEIEECAQTLQPDIIAIDAPLIRGKPRVRTADILLRKYKALPPTLPSMRPLTRRGSHLAVQLLQYGRIIEVFPTATAKLLGIYHINYRDIATLLNLEVKNKHELDAYLCCLTGKLFLKKKTRSIGDEDGEIIVPEEGSDCKIKRNLQ